MQPMRHVRPPRRSAARVLARPVGPSRAVPMLLTALTLLLAALWAAPAPAQNLFSPVITVNGQPITLYQLRQRELFLRLVNASGNIPELAREQLIQERLQLDAARAAGIQIDEQALLAGMEEFAARANLSREEFVKAIAARGVDEDSFRAFMRAGLAWRELVQARFGAQSQVSDSEVDRALSINAGSNVRVLLSEIIMPAPPAQAEVVRARAERISQMTTIGAFAQAARRYSATPTRGAGGRLPWQNLSDLPPVLVPLILGLAPGEVTAPIPIPNAIALFQLRAIEETDYTAPGYAAIEYATYLLPGGRSEENIAAARRIAQTVDRCDDLYGVAKDQPEDRLARISRKPAEIPTDIGIELSKLDAGEVSYSLTRGDALMLVMLCGRTTQQAEEVDRANVTLGLRNRRLQSLADGYLAELKAGARIVEK